jgi:hypothetical protein
MDLKKLIKEVLESRKPDCGCGCGDKCGKAPILNENLQSRVLMTENMKYHIDNKLPLTENTFRYGSKAFLDLWAEARFLYSRNAVNVSGIDKEILTETKLGEYGLFEGQMVPLDMPMLEEVLLTEDNIAELEKIKKEIEALMPRLSWIDNIEYSGYSGDLDIELDYELNPQEINQLSQLASKYGMNLLYKTGKNATLTKRRIPSKANELNEAEYQGKKVQIGKPKRGGASGKKFYVYVMDKGKVKKVSFGDSGGLSTKVNDPKARQAFAKRHKCAQKTDRTTAGYWSCRIGRYWKSLGGSKNFSGYW